MTVFETIKKILFPVDPLKEVRDQIAANFVERTEVIRDGVRLAFIERKDGSFLILAERRTKPLLNATFLCEKGEALAWRDSAIVPAGERAELFEKFKEGTWPTR